MSHKFVFVTGNMYKVRVMEKFLGYKIEHHELDLPEIQSLDAEKVLEDKTKEAYKILKKPVLVDDVSLCVHSMGNLPGTLVKFFLKSVGTDGICKMVDSFGDRTATAVTIFGFYDGKKFHSFSGELTGSISPVPKGDTGSLAGMGWNSIFIPPRQTQTLAEMGDGFEKHTPRAIAVEKLKKFLETYE